MARAFTHRAAFGAWINDMRNEAMPTEKWPYATVDDRTVEDVLRCLELQAQAGFNDFDVFGLFTSYAWPTDIRSAVDAERDRHVRQILDGAHRLGMRVVCGLGVYSWGFDEIIAANPGVRGTNPRAMCQSREESWTWMTKVVDFILTEYEVDGFHFESSDQGRCTCADCSVWGNVEYHSNLNSRVADYIRERWPDKVLMLNMCGYVPWGATIDHSDYPHLVRLSEHIDCIIDPGHVGRGFIDETSRREFIASLSCDFGTSGGAWVYPPQRWERLRWFLPYTEATGRHMRALYEDGGRAVDFYMGPVVNPGVEMNIAYGGRLMADVDRSDEEILGDAVEALYRPKTAAARQGLVEIFQRAELAYYDNFTPHPPRSRETPGELHLAPLFGDEPGPPIYLTGTRPDDMPFDNVGLAAYAADLEALVEDVRALGGEVDDAGRTERIEACLRNTLADIRAL